MNKYLIKDIVLVVNGSTPSTKREDFYNGDIVWITPKDLSNLNSKYISKGEKSITELGYRSCSTTLIPKGSILLSSRAPIGLLAIAKNELCTNQGFKNLVLNNDLVINEFLYYWLKTKIEYISSLGTGTTFKEVSKHVIENIEIDLPSYSTQKQIAKVLSDLDAKIEVNNKINKELEAMAKTLYDYWFVQFDFPYDFEKGKPDINGKPYKSSGGKMVYNEELKREIPEGWEVGIIENLLAKEQLGGKTLSSEYLDSGNIPIIDQSIKFICGYTNDESKRIKAKVPRIVFGDHTRILKLINFDFARGADGTQILLSKEERVPQHFFYHSLLKIDLSNYGYARHFKFLKDTKTIIPYLDVVENYEEKAKTWFEMIWTNLKQNQKLSELRDWLLPMLMNGQVSVGEEERLSMVAEEREKYNKI